MSLRIGAIVEARMTSSRLPGKHLLPVLGQPIIGHLIKRLQSISLVDDVIVAMTVRSEDDNLEAYVRSTGATVFRGMKMMFLAVFLRRHRIQILT